MTCIDCNTKEAAPKRRVCYACKTARDREINPIIIMFHNHIKNAKRRGKIFNLPYDYYKNLVISTGYLEKRGRQATGLTIDCIIPHLDYIVGNVRVISKSLNCSKGIKTEDIEGIYYSNLPAPF